MRAGEVRCAGRSAVGQTLSRGLRRRQRHRVRPPDGRRLLDEVTFRVGEGAKVALVGPNGAGKTTLLRIVAGDLAAARGGGDALRRARASCASSSARCATTRRCATCCCRSRRTRSGPPRAAVDAGRAGDDGARRRADPDALRPGAGRLGRRRRLRGRDTLGRLHGRRRSACRSSGPSGARCDPVRRRAEAAGARGAAARAGRGAAARRAGQLPRRRRPSAGSRTSCCESPKTVLFVSHDRELLARTATRIVTLEPGPAGSTAWVHGGGFATLPPGPRGPDHAARGAAPALGRGARQAQGAGPDVPAEGGVQRRHGQPRCRRRRPGWRKFEEAGPPEERPREQKVTMRLRGGRTGKRARRLRAARADRADEAVRPRGLVRRAGRGARAPTGRASRTSCGCWPRGGTDPDVEHRPVEAWRSRR